MRPDDVPLPESASVFAIANTPFFLLRQLQGGSEARQLAAALSRAAAGAATTLEQAVRPYVYLVALSTDISALRAATTINLTYQDDWFVVARQALIDSYRSTSVQTIAAPHVRSASAVTATTSSSTNVTKIVAG
jgi:hypothetical protein